jgi:hypothetical protein
MPQRVEFYQGPPLPLRGEGARPTFEPASAFLPGGPIRTRRHPGSVLQEASNLILDAHRELLDDKPGPGEVLRKPSGGPE